MAKIINLSILINIIEIYNKKIWLITLHRLQRVFKH